MAYFFAFLLSLPATFFPSFFAPCFLVGGSTFFGASATTFLATKCLFCTGSNLIALLLFLRNCSVHYRPNPNLLPLGKCIAGEGPCEFRSCDSGARGGVKYGSSTLPLVCYLLYPWHIFLSFCGRSLNITPTPVSYTHLTLPTNREV
eukprot:TRINITY_DN607_c0_g1_i14.p1 TRINITY_DN607_c0_g1~~TRINITY_DN607_c0_g1_i14.p1  ORF type:complete len:147 (+),score=0.89 TRINITY_DN607_c0_g1_i14:70-510(+)